MAIRYKVLGQKKPAANTEWDVYTVSGTKDAIINCITVANMDADNSATYRISVRPDSSVALNLGITINQNDVLTIRSSSGTVVFNVFGAELDV